MLQALDRAIDGVTRAMLLAAGVILVLLVLMVNVEVVSRYFLNRSTLIADEYGGYALVWICLLGFSQALSARQFLSVTALVDILPLSARRVSVMGGALVGLALAMLLAYTTFQLAHSNFRFGSVSIQPSATPLWIPQLILPLGFAWLCVVYLQQFARAAFPRALDRSDRS